MHPAIITMIVAWAFVGVWITAVIMAQKNHHPKALFVLFFTELWERFSYYGMRALLVLYMTKALFYGDGKAYGVYAAYGALVYSTPVLGGLLAERFLGYRHAIMLGAVLMAFGHFAMAFEYELIFFLALGFLVIGNGFFKPNISSMVGTFYSEGDQRRDAAFTIFYMGINTGAFLTPLTCGTIGEIYGWHWGFTLAGIGMITGLGIFSYGIAKGYFKDKGLEPVKAIKNHKHFNWKILIYIGAFLSVPFFGLLVNQSEITEWILIVLGIGILITLFVMALFEEKVQRQRLFVLLVLFVFITMFWTFFELAGSAITLFTERNVDRMVWGYEIPTSTFQSVNPFFIIILAPVFAWIWEKTGKAGKEPSAPVKFSLALTQLGLGFGVLVLGSYFAGANFMVPLVFLIFGYLLHTTGELCISPIGLSLVTKLSPTKIVAFVMGVWFLSSAFAHIMGGEISKLTTIPTEGETLNVMPLAKLELGLKTYSGVFETIAFIAIGSALILLILNPLLKRWMHGVK